LPEVLEKTLRSYSQLHRTFIFFSLLSILLTITLSVLEAKGIESFGCGGCGKALSSPVAEPFGIHLSWLGVVFYTSLFILSLKFSPPLFFLSILLELGFFISLGLTAYAALELKTFCTWCLGSFTIVLTLLCIISIWIKKTGIATTGFLPKLNKQFVPILGIILFSFGLFRAGILYQVRAGTTSSRTNITSISSRYVPQELGKGSGRVLGSDLAPIRIVEFYDPDCGRCRNFLKNEFQLIKKTFIDAGLIRYEVRFVALPTSKMARIAECVAENGNFFEFRDRYTSLGNIDERSMIELAVQSGVRDRKEFEACLSDLVIQSVIREDIRIASRLNLTAVPSLWIDGKVMQGRRNFEEYKLEIRKALQRHSK